MNPLFMTMEWVRFTQVWGKMANAMMLAMTEYWMDITEPYNKLKGGKWDDA